MPVVERSDLLKREEPGVLKNPKKGVYIFI
jgi:hypothetical protein